MSMLSRSGCMWLQDLLVSTVDTTLYLRANHGAKLQKCSCRYSEWIHADWNWRTFSGYVLGCHTKPLRHSAPPTTSTSSFVVVVIVITVVVVKRLDGSRVTGPVLEVDVYFLVDPACVYLVVVLWMLAMLSMVRCVVADAATTFGMRCGTAACTNPQSISSCERNGTKKLARLFCVL